MRKFILLTGILLLLAATLSAQNALRLEQQKTLFIYGQLNLHTGFSNDGAGLQFGLPGRGSANQLSLQFFKQNQANLQRGFVPLFSLDSWKIRVSTAYGQTSTTFTTPAPVVIGPGGPRGPGGQAQELPDLVGTTTSGNVLLNLQDAWLKFKTKWDRTSVKVGYASIPYGHNPAIDPVVNFMTNLASRDLGLNRDLGVFVKTALTPNLDLEMGLSSGGLLSSSLLQTNPAEADDADASASTTWLLTGRLGQPSFRQSEAGLLFAAGNVAATFGDDAYMRIVRVGGDWVYKVREQLRVTNQLVIGQTAMETEGNFVAVGLQNNFDVFLTPKFIMSLSNSLNVQGSTEGAGTFVNSTIAGSLTYAVSPHTRFRLNQFVTPKAYDGGSNWGISLQFVTGLGKR